MGFWSAVGDIVSSDAFGKTLQGVGSVAGAWGAYEIGKEQNKIAKAQLAYEQNKDKITADKQAQAQAELDNALANVYGTKKKKADQTPGSLSDAFTAPVMAV